MAAAIVVAVIAGGAFIANRNQPDVGAPTPSPTPTIAPSATPTSVGALYNQPRVSCGNEGPMYCVAPGTYQLTSAVDWPATVTLNVPEGWEPWSPGNAPRDYEGLLVGDGPTGTDGSGWEWCS